MSHLSGSTFLVIVGAILIIATSHWMIGSTLVSIAIISLNGNRSDIGNDDLDP